MREIYYSKDGTISAEIEGKCENGKTLFCVYYDNWYGKYEQHEIKYYAWAQRLHGNAPSGTPYGYITASRNGKRVILTV